MDSYLERLKKEPVRVRQDDTKHSWRPTSPHERSTPVVVYVYSIISLLFSLGGSIVLVNSITDNTGHIPFLFFVMLGCGLLFMKLSEQKNA